MPDAAQRALETYLLRHLRVWCRRESWLLLHFWRGSFRALSLG
jgi:hypothetical protein